MACKLSLIPGTTDFAGDTGAKVKLVTKDHVGNVLIAKAEYNGKPLMGENQAVAKIELTVAKGSHTLKCVCVFTASTMGRGELREVDGADSQFIRALSGHEPFQAIRIEGK
jgi:hypothetical protein